MILVEYELGCCSRQWEWKCRYRCPRRKRVDQSKVVVVVVVVVSLAAGQSRYARVEERYREKTSNEPRRFEMDQKVAAGDRRPKVE